MIKSQKIGERKEERKGESREKRGESGEGDVRLTYGALMMLIWFWWTV